MRVTNFLKKIEPVQKAKVLECFNNGASCVVKKDGEFLAVNRSGFELDSLFVVTLFIYGPISMGRYSNPPKVESEFGGFIESVKALENKAQTIYSMSLQLKSKKNSANSSEGERKSALDSIVLAMQADIDIELERFKEIRRSVRVEAMTMDESWFESYWNSVLVNRDEMLSGYAAVTEDELEIMEDLWGKHDVPEIPYKMDKEYWPIEDPEPNMILPSEFVILSPEFNPTSCPPPYIQLP